MREDDGLWEAEQGGVQGWAVAVVVGLGGIVDGPGREQDELQDEPLGVPYGGLLVGEEGELGWDEVEEVGVGVPHRQVEEVQSPRQVCPGKDRLLLLPRESLLGEESRCSHRCSP